jgi:oligopeptidase B
MTRFALMLPALLLILVSCQETTSSGEKITGQSDFEAPPSAKIQPSTFEEHGSTRVDPYYWLKDKTNPEVIAYLNSENAYADQVMAETKDLQETLFQELKGRIKEDDSSVPQLRNGYYYYSRTETGQQYPVYCRKKGNLDAPEEILIDGNALADGQTAFIFGGYEVSPDNNILAFAYNYTGSYVEFDIRFKNLSTGELLPDNISASSNFEWANDNKTLFYGMNNAALRPWRIYRHTLGAAAEDPLVYEELDDLFSVYVYKSKTGDYLFLNTYSFTSSETRYLSANQPEGAFQVFRPREKDVDYTVAHHKDKFIILYKDPQHKNRKVMEAPLSGFSDKNTWKDVLPYDPEVLIQSVDVFADYLVLSARSGGLEELRYLSLSSGKTEKVSFPEPVYTLNYNGSGDYTATGFRYTYASLNRPPTTFDYDMIAGSSEKLKEQEIPSGFNPDDYVVERLWATAPDGVKVPMAVFYRKGLQKDGNNPAYIYSYGSYGSSTDAWFRSDIISLVDRGFVYAIAQIRGGSELGEEWYEQGKLLNKKNTFTDFIACTEHLVKEKFTSPELITANGGSAGGLLMGVVANMRPDLYRVIVADVPFVDVINTMLDENLPLTTQEWEQWGDPRVKEYYDYMLSYSPYDNIEAKNYPNMLITGGLNDSQVLFHEPAKYAARLRANKTDNNVLLLRTNMESGHGGATGRFDRLRETAFEFGFILDRLGMKAARKKENIKG